MKYFTLLGRALSAFSLVILSISYVKAQSNALNFDGIDDHLQTGITASSLQEIDDVFQDDFTIEFWVRFDDNTPRVIISKGSGNSETFSIQTTSEGKIAFYIGSAFLESNEPINDGNWHHVVFIRDLSEGEEEGDDNTYIELYIEAIPQSSFIELFDNLPMSPSSSLLIGKSADGFLPNFEGELDELRIWSDNRGCPDIFANKNNRIDSGAEDLFIYFDYDQGIGGGDNTAEVSVANKASTGSDFDGILNGFSLTGSFSNFVSSTADVFGTTPSNEAQIFVEGFGKSGSRVIMSGDNSPSDEDGTDFGFVDPTSGTVRSFYIVNGGNSDLNVVSVSVTGSDFSSLNSTFSPISNCSSTLIDIDFNPSSSGIKRGTVTIEYQDPSGGGLNLFYTFDVQGRGGALTQLENGGSIISTSVDFGNGIDRCDGEVIETITIKNDGLSNLVIQDIVIVGSSDFSLKNRPNVLIAPNESSSFDISFLPTTSGPQSATIEVRSDNQTNVTNPNQGFNVVGASISQYNGAGVPKLEVRGLTRLIANGDNTPSSTDQTDFGSIDTSDDRTITYIIRNTGSAPLYLEDIALGDGSEFFLTPLPSLPQTIGIGSIFSFDVNYNPAVAGTHTDEVIIKSDDCLNDEYKFTIEADGVNPPINESIDVRRGLTPIFSSDNIGEVLVCRGGSFIYTITNNGNVNVNIDNVNISGDAEYSLSYPPRLTDILIPGEARRFVIDFDPIDANFKSAFLNVAYTGFSTSSSFSFSIDGQGELDTRGPFIPITRNFTRQANRQGCVYLNVNDTTRGGVTRIVAPAFDNCEVSEREFRLTGATTATTNTLFRQRFNLGTTRVRWFARDEAGNVSRTDEFLVTIVDETPPVLLDSIQDITIQAPIYECSVEGIAIELETPNFFDPCEFEVENDAPEIFEAGRTLVTWTATDVNGNTSEATQNITVQEYPFVIQSDSLALVSIYNETGGEDWNRSWNLSNPVFTWDGVSVSCGRVSSLDLSGNNLTGTLPNTVLNLSSLNQAGFTLNISNNRLGFDSAEDFVNLISSFVYAPQADIYQTEERLIQEGSSITFTTETAGNFNTYQWYKDNVAISGATDPELTLTNVVVADAGVYTAFVKNTKANRLVLERKPIHLEVEGFVDPLDSLALVEIFQSTNGQNWTNPWNLFDPVATWQGVTLSGNKVIELDLSGQNLSGTLPNVFDAELFQEMTYLSLFDNQIEGEIPSTLGDLITLTYLDLDKNQFEGKVPSSFGNLINLTTLWLSRNNLDELPEEITNLVKLKTLYLNDNLFESLPENIGNLLNLTVLNLSHNQFRELPVSLTNLNKLNRLYLNNNLLDSLPEGIQKLIALTVLELTNNNLSDLPDGISELVKLIEVRLGENKLEFDDLLPFADKNLSVFEYAPQALIDEKEELLVVLGTRLSLDVSTQGDGNIYAWYLNEEFISNFKILEIRRASNRNVGVYIALVTNPKLPDLTLERRTITLNVECPESLNFSLVEPNRTVFCEGQPFSLKLSIDTDVSSASQIRWRKDGIIISFAKSKDISITQTGTYRAEILTPSGCIAKSNSIEVTTQEQPEVEIKLLNDEVLVSNLLTDKAVTYQWLRNGLPILDATDSTHTPTQSGDYSLLVLTEAGCNAVSLPITFTTDVTTGSPEPIQFRAMTIFPNPNDGNFVLDFGSESLLELPNFNLIDALGRNISLKAQQIAESRFQITTSQLAGGVYYLQVQTKEGIATRKFVVEE